MNNVWLAFITGLTTGGISCLAVQGGLLSSSVANQQESGLVEKVQKTRKWRVVAAFLASKVFIYTLLGAGLGFLGASLSLSPVLLGWMQIAAGLFMLLTAARLLNIHPIFRHFVIQPPKWAFRLMRPQSTSKSFFAPILLGLATVLIPCGVTQTMMVLAVASGSPIWGAAIMFAFTLGTSPVFFALGVATLELLKKKSFSFAAASVIALLGIISINAGQTIRGSSHTLANYFRALTSLSEDSKQGPSGVAGVNTSGVQEVEIAVQSTGYSASASTLKVGVPVKLELVTNRTNGCARAFTIPSLKISKILPETGTESIEFTPTQKGTLVYTCSMGMYSGYFEVI
jgi:sulfite exporter TauE/SafE